MCVTMSLNLKEVSGARKRTEIGVEAILEKGRAMK